MRVFCREDEGPRVISDVHENTGKLPGQQGDGDKRKLKKYGHTSAKWSGARWPRERRAIAAGLRGSPHSARRKMDIFREFFLRKRNGSWN